ncbi:Alpha/Beta hydrolase protein [Crucibulum laeve]|uniref:Carboxylic ester hydrolase n=1 Tax=Crucibulum laeve TaxID=68775 RepID=A0A5C3LNC6_9AGAR|nr:Alpha/Beta hydrolase protein [Crucibulum laeve]
MHPNWTSLKFISPHTMLLSAVVVLAGSYVFRNSLLTLSTPQGDIVDTGYAKYLGNRSFPNTVAYLGIPYAEPPVGDRRFRAPLPLNTTRISQTIKGVVDATNNPEFCIQGTIGAGDAGGAGSEDCLKVNIYAPVGANRGSNLPVLVYFHGGGYVYGNPANWPFDHWIQQSPNVVIVSVYYRLSSFGFLAIPEFRSPANGDLNAGFQDQIQALKWVKQHIASFGGNPQKVTINGESAGGSSVELHLVANENEKLFSGAIAQSVFRTPLPTPEQQQPLFDFYAERAGCSTGSALDKIACLRTASISALARAQDAGISSAFTASGYNVFHPVLDGKIITEFPTKSILAGKFARVPLIVGATTNETLSGGTDPAVSLKSFFPSLTTADIDTILEAYPSTDFASDALRFQTITGESELKCARPILGAAFALRTKAWTYRYNQRNPTSGGSGVGHASENWMMFRGTNTGTNGTTTFTQMTPTEQSFAAELIAYWLSFVRSGDPNTHKLARSPTWAPYTSNRARIVLQEDPSNSTTKSGSVIESETLKEVERCAVVASKVDIQQN